MRWDPVAAADIDDLIVFDGDCVLCSRLAHFVHERDAAQRFKFVAIQSEYGRALAARFGIDADNPPTTVAVVDGVAYFKGDAALVVLEKLPQSAWTPIARTLPSALRDWLYDRIARNRYQIFGRQERCWAGDAALVERVLERAPRRASEIGR
jgi:predicted DCC family thiol-disulfide oxidoreductase YuxK